MPARPDTTTGTITLTAGAVEFTTSGTNLLTRGHLPGDTIRRNGLVLTIKTITGENSGTLEDPCPAGAAGTDVPVRIRWQADGSRVAAVTRNLMDQLSSSAFFQYDASGTLAQRSAYDDAAQGFSYLNIDTDPHTLYIKKSDTSADWSSGVSYAQGAKGDPGLASGLSYRYTTTTVESDTPVGYLKFNNAPASATKLWIDPYDVGGAFTGNFITAWDDTGATALRGRLVLRSRDNPAMFWSFNVTGSVVTKTSYYEITVVPLSVYNALAENANVDVIFIPTGPTGPQGDQGNAGPGNVLSIGTVTSTDGDPVVEVVGSSPAQLLNFTLKRGPQGVPGQNFQPDQTGPASGRSAYNSEAHGFSYLETDTGYLYFRQGVTTGVWSTPLPFVRMDIPPMDGFRVGMVLGHNLADLTYQSIDVSPGSVASDDGTTLLKLTSTLTKRINANWAAGNANGGLDTGTKAPETSYGVYVIGGPSVPTDVIFTTSVSSPVMPSGYTKKRYLGTCIVASSSNIRYFKQYGNKFEFTSQAFYPVTTTVNSSARSLITLPQVPNGRNVEVDLQYRIYKPGDYTLGVIQSPDYTDTAVTTPIANVGSGLSNGSMVGTIRCFTNTSRQVSARTMVDGVTLDLYVRGWVDPYL